MIMSADQRAVLVSDTIETEDWFIPPQIDDSNKRPARQGKAKRSYSTQGAPLWVAPPLVSTVVGIWSLILYVFLPCNDGLINGYCPTGVELPIGYYAHGVKSSRNGYARYSSPYAGYCDANY